MGTPELTPGTKPERRSPPLREAAFQDPHPQQLLLPEPAAPVARGPASPYSGSVPNLGKVFKDQVY